MSPLRPRQRQCRSIRPKVGRIFGGKKEICGGPDELGTPGKAYQRRANYGKAQPPRKGSGAGRLARNELVKMRALGHEDPRTT